MKNFENAVKNNVIAMVGCKFARMRYISEVKTTKAQKAEVGGCVTKIVDGMFQVNYSYENAVNNRAEKQVGESVEFKAESLRWGKWLVVNKLIEHNSELYLRFYGVKGGKVENTYFVDGEQASAEQVAIIRSWEKKVESGRQSEVGLTENQVIARSVKLSNILYFATDGVVLDKTLYGVQAV